MLILKIKGRVTSYFKKTVFLYTTSIFSIPYSYTITFILYGENFMDETKIILLY